MDEDSVWSDLGSKILGSGKMDELTDLIRNIQMELMGTMEAMTKRVLKLEERIEELLQRPTAHSPSNNTGPMEDSVYVFMSHEELGLTPERREYVDVDGSDKDVRVVSNGFVAPPPADIPDDELSIDEEFASKNKIAEMVEDEYPTLLKDEDSLVIAEVVDEISDEVKAAYASYKNKETKWMDFVRASGGMKRASQYRQILSEESD